MSRRRNPDTHSSTEEHGDLSHTSPVHVVVLAAGKGTRMRSALPKVLHLVAGLPMIEHVLRAAEQLAPTSTSVVIGHLAEQVRHALRDRPGLRFAVQQQQLGTAHAFLQAEPLLAGARGTLVMMPGDVPLLRAETLRQLVAHHQESGAVATFLTAVLDRPYGYPRVIRSAHKLTRIVEERDASPSQRRIHEVNTGIYAFEMARLFDSVRRIGTENAQGEYYLPEVISVFRRDRLLVETLLTDSADEIRGINSRTELAEVSRMVRQSKNEELMAAGVTIEDPATTFVGPDVTVGTDTVIHPGVYLEGRTTIGTACEIHSGARLVDAILGDGVVVNNFCVIVGAHLEAGARVGPFAHLRPESTVCVNARVGNFVELKKTVLGPGSKANHLAYLGDATIGADVNVGAGTITCNYDGKHKHPTVIEDGAFIGSDTQLIAPVRVGRGAYVAAGSSITKDVPPGALGVARAHQINKEGWAERKAAKDTDPQP